MHPQLRLIAAQQHIADLQRAADHDRLVHSAASVTTATPSAHPAPPPPRQSRSCACMEMTPHLDHAQPGRPERCEERAGDHR